jgi:tRNA A-37 threonylcarbamoyl transferase component Bud32
MTDLPTSACPDCGELLPPESPQSLCPACLMRQALASRTIASDGDKTPHLPPPSPEEIADRFPGYEILECLGRGGMGAVYKARQKSLNRLVAIKILAPERVGEGRFAERFTIEAELLAKLGHPHIVTIHDFGETGGLFYLVMEFIDGVNLRDLLRDGKLEPQQALAIVPPICDALQYAHDKGIVHRDIKPENILLDRDGRVKIADFGIASLVGASGENSGTPPYMAPEQSGGTVDRRADIYALGVVLYEMLTGERPEKDLVAPSKRVEVSVKIDEMVLRALEKEPERRYQTAGEFRTIVETIAANPPNRMEPERDETGVTGETRHVGSGRALFAQFKTWAARCGWLSVIALGTKNIRPTQFHWRVGLIMGLAFGAVITCPRLVNDYLIRRAGAVIPEQLARQAIIPHLEAESLRWETMRFEPNTVSPSDVIVRFTKLERVGTLHDQAVVKSLKGILNLRTLDGILWRADGLEDLRGIQFNFRIGDTAGHKSDEFVRSDYLEGSEKPFPNLQSRRVANDAEGVRSRVVYDWHELDAKGALKDGVVEKTDGRTVLKIESLQDEPFQARLLTIENPPINTKRYAVRGEIRYQDVQGAAYLEMWNDFPRGRFFTRTLNEPGSGPMGQITGNSDWRPFILPFDQMGIANSPNRIEVNLHLPGRGAVFVGPLELIEFSTDNGFRERVPGDR